MLEHPFRADGEAPRHNLATDHERGILAVPTVGPDRVTKLHHNEVVDRVSLHEELAQRPLHGARVGEQRRQRPGVEPVGPKEHRIPQAVEVMINTPRIRDMIIDASRTLEIIDAIKDGAHPYGMVSFDQSLTELVQRRLVTYEMALAASTNPDDFALYFRGVSEGAGPDGESIQFEDGYG
jgi:hypothetical protein